MPREQRSCGSIQETDDIICFENFSPYLPYLIVRVHLVRFIGSMWCHHSVTYHAG